MVAVDGEALRAPPVLDGQGQRPQPRERVAPAAVVLAPVDEPGVDPERDVVQEEPVAGAGDVDAALGSVVERGQRRDRVVAVEAQVAGEVIPRPERDADERDVLLQRDLRDGGERAVAAGHPEHVRARAPGELGQIVALLEKSDVDAAGAGGVAQLLRGRGVGAGVRIDDEDRSHRVGSRRPER